MKIGIVFRHLSATEGGAYSYIQTLTGLLREKNEASKILIINIIEDYNNKKWATFEENNLILNTEAAPLDISAQKELKKLQKKLWWAEVMLFKLKLPKAKLWQQKAAEAIRVHKKKYINLNDLLKEVALEYQINLFYYPKPFYTPCRAVPYITTIWDCGHRTIPQFAEVSANGEYEKREEWFRKALSEAVGVVVESEAGLRELQKFFGLEAAKTFLMPMFASAALLNADQHKANTWFQKQAFAKKQFLLYPAQFWAHKNHDNLLKALRIAHVHQPEIHLVLCGSDQGHLKVVQELVAELDLSQNVHFLGFVATEELKLLYINALALIMPTFLGPTNMPLTEAQQLGCPVLCSALEGHYEQTGRCALFFEPDNPEMMAEQILRIYEDQNLRHELIAKGREVVTHNEPELYAADLLAFLKNSSST